MLTINGLGNKEVIQTLSDGSQKTYYLPEELDSVRITEGCEEIPWGCFYNCSMIVSMVLPESLNLVGENAFFGCGGLEDIYCLSTNPSAAYDNTFDGVRIATCRLHVPAGTADLYRRSRRARGNNRHGTRHLHREDWQLCRKSNGEVTSPTTTQQYGES